MPAAPLTLLGNYRPDRQHSMLGYEALLVEVATALGLGVPPVLYPRAQLGALVPEAWPRLHGLAGRLDKYALFPLRLAFGRRRPFVQLADHASALYLPALRPGFALATCHDLIPWLAQTGELAGWQPSRRGGWLLERIARALVQADHIVSVSEATRTDLIRLLDYPAERITVIPNCLRPHVTPEAPPTPAENRSRLQEAGLPTENDWLFLAFSGTFYKNAAGALAIFAALRRHLPPESKAHLAIVGYRDVWAVEALEKLKLAGHATLLGRVGPPLLQTLYHQARLLLAPSLYEGFGWPVVEAQQLGLPVACSTRGSLGEVAREGALLLGLEDPAADAARLLELLESPAALEAQIEAGRHNVQRFTWERFRTDYATLYRRLGLPVREPTPGGTSEDTP